MPENWRLKFLLSLSLLLIALYFLFPTLAHFEQIREKADQSGEEPPFYVNLFPREEIKLGLDLRGGIYVELEVEVEDAVRNRADLITTEIERLTASEPFQPEKLLRDPEGSGIVVTLQKEEDRSPFRNWIDRNYRDILLEKEGKNGEKTVPLDLTPSFRKQTEDSATRQSLETIRNRIDRYGVAEPSIVRLGQNRISVELPGMSDPDRALALIKKAGRLEFKMVDESVPDDEVRRIVSEAKGTDDETFTEEAVKKLNDLLKGKIPEESEVLFEIQRDPVTKKIVGGLPYLLKKKTEVTGEMLRNAQVNVQDNEPYVSLSLNPLGTRLFADLTKANVGKRLAIVLDGSVSKAPVIKSEIPSGEAQITLGFGDYSALLREAEDLTLVLREGALPARLKELTKTVVGPSLGRDSIDRGVRVSWVAGLLVMLFMIVYYRLSGLLADLALTFNILMTLGALAIFQATLTLPGIAGIVLTIGMAVDANVLIFERMREELRAGRTARSALQAGYQNAMRAILDSNITTFLAAVVLYQFGTGPIRGFAVTLMIGITTTLFTAIVLTRVLQEGILFGLKRERLSV